MKRICAALLLAGCFLLFARQGAIAQDLVRENDGLLSLRTRQFQPTYQLLGVKGGAGAAASVTTPVGPIIGGTYTVRCNGTWGGATVTLLALQPDGSSFATATDDSGTTITWSSTKLQQPVYFGQGAVVKPQINGGTNPVLWCLAS